MGTPTHHVQMSAWKASGEVNFVPKNRPDGLTFNLIADLHTSETGKHQDQVKVLIEKTASSLDDTALKMLFISVQRNNIELCIQHAIKEYVTLSLLRKFDRDNFFFFFQFDW